MKKKEQKTYYIETLGCKVNQYESDAIAAGLKEKGFAQADTGQKADLCIVNTCAVTSKAGMQSRQAVRKLIRQNPDARIVVTGCHAQTDPDLIREIDKVDHIVCHRDKDKIADCLAGPGPQTEFEFRKPAHNAKASFLNFDRPVQGSMTRAYLKIQDGCNAFCTYCIVPYARGASVSMPEDEVVRHLNHLAAAGFQEVIIAGIHTGMYGLDLDPPTTLEQLLTRLDQTPQVPQVRISSIEPREITQGIIDLAGPGHILCDHFHIPLQSGDDTILKKMKRPYTTEAFKAVIHNIHDYLPFAGIGLDIIIGFPGETDQEFENTYALVASLPVSYLHVFPFSPRKGTPAFHFEPKVHSKTIKQRCALMRDLGRKKQKAFIQANQGRRLRALVQHEVDKSSGMLRAVTRNYLTVFLEKNDDLKGKVVDLVYEQCDSDLNLIGRVVAPGPVPKLPGDNS